MITINRKPNGFWLNKDSKLTYFAKTSDLDRDSYGLDLYIYENSEPLFFITQKSWATSLYLNTSVHWNIHNETTEVSDVCSDPRILMVHILTGKLMIMSRWGRYDEALAEQEINAVLPNPTIKEAEEWLERNRFTGEKAYSKSKRRSDYPGWDIANDDYDFVYLTPEIRVLYDKYKRLWKEREARRNG